MSDFKLNKNTGKFNLSKDEPKEETPKKGFNLSKDEPKTKPEVQANIPVNQPNTPSKKRL